MFSTLFIFLLKILLFKSKVKKNLQYFFLGPVSERTNIWISSPERLQWIDKYIFNMPFYLSIINEYTIASLMTECTLKRSRFRTLAWIQKAPRCLLQRDCPSPSRSPCSLPLSQNEMPLQDSMNHSVLACWREKNVYKILLSKQGFAGNVLWIQSILCAYMLTHIHADNLKLARYRNSQHFQRMFYESKTLPS